jgi:hypothetical protein
LEHDKRPKIALAVIRKLADDLGVTLDWLVYGDQKEVGLSQDALLETQSSWESMES